MMQCFTSIRMSDYSQAKGKQELCNRFSINNSIYGISMKLQDAINLSKSWGDKPCEHPSLVKESNMGFSTGDYVCTQCGRNVDYDDWVNKKMPDSSKAK